MKLFRSGIFKKEKKNYTWLERNCIDVAQLFEEVEGEEDWRWRLIDDEWSVDMDDEGLVLGGVVFGWRGRSVREPGWMNVADWSEEGFWRSCSLNVRGRFIDS